MDYNGSQAWDYELGCCQWMSEGFYCDNKVVVWLIGNTIAHLDHLIQYGSQVLE